MAETIRLNRRNVMKVAGAGAAAALAGPLRLEGAEPAKVNGNLKQSVCQWCYQDIPLEKLAAEASRIGYRSVELLTPEQCKVVKPYGLTCAMLSGACTIPDGFNQKENHERLETSVRKHVEFAADNGLPNVIVFSGNRRGMSDEEGLEICRKGSNASLAWLSRRRSRFAWSCLTARSTTRITCATARRGAWRW